MYYKYKYLVIEAAFEKLVEMLEMAAQSIPNEKAELFVKFSTKSDRSGKGMYLLYASKASTIHAMMNYCERLGISTKGYGQIIFEDETKNKGHNKGG